MPRSLIASMPLLVLALWLLPTNSAAGEGPTPDEDRSLQDLFFAEYPDAARRLESSVETIAGRTTCKFSKPDQPAEWIPALFYKSGPRIRVDINPSTDGRNDRNKSRWMSQAILITPGQASVVAYPQSRLAQLERTSVEPSVGDLAKATIVCLRLIEGAYCFDANSVIRKIKEGTWSVRGVTKSSDSPGHVTVHFGISDRVRSGVTELKQLGEAWLTFSRQESWAIRRWHLEFAEPQSTRVEGVIEEFVPIGDGYVPRKATAVDFRRARPSEPWQEAQRTEYELVEWNTGSIAENTFTVAGLGISEPVRIERSGWTWPLTLVLAALVLGGLVYVARRSFPRASQA